MTDRELLELAARAAGMPPTPKEWQIPDHLPVVFTYEGRDWNPLTDDGDALRLATKLRLLVNVTEFFSHATDGSELDGEELHNGDACAATRRAIVRAAAAIGQRMETQAEKNARFRRALDEMPTASPLHPLATLENKPTQAD